MNIKYWVKSPHLIWARLRYWLWEQLNPQKPWLSPAAVTFCEGALDKAATRAFEFGSGKSTAWFAKRVEHLTSVEHSAKWYTWVRGQITASALLNVDYRLVLLDHKESEPERDHYDPVPSYVRVLASFPDESFDIIIVDGHYRNACIRAASSKLAEGGLLLVDDIDMWGAAELVPVSTKWSMVHLSGNGMKRTAIWKKHSKRNRNV